MKRIEKIGISLFGAAILAVLTVSRSGHVCSDCDVIRESYDVLGIPMLQWKNTTPLTELLDRYAENPPHSHRYVQVGRTSFFTITDGAGGVLLGRIRQKEVMDFLDSIYRFEDRHDARRWRERLLGSDESIERFREILSGCSSQEIPKDDAAWRVWWGACRSKFEITVFRGAATAP